LKYTFFLKYTFLKSYIFLINFYSKRLLFKETFIQRDVFLKILLLKILFIKLLQFFFFFKRYFLIRRYFLAVKRKHRTIGLPFSGDDLIYPAAIASASDCNVGPISNYIRLYETDGELNSSIAACVSCNMAGAAHVQESKTKE